MAGLDPATQMDVQVAGRVRLGPRVEPADDGAESWLVPRSRNKEAGSEDPAVVRKQAAWQRPIRAPGVEMGLFPRKHETRERSAADPALAALRQEARRTRRLQRVEQVAAVDAEIVEAMLVEVEQGFEGNALHALGAEFSEDSHHPAGRVEGRGGGSRPLARKHERHGLLHHFALSRREGTGGGAAMSLADDGNMGDWTPIRPTNRFHPRHQIL